jgi:hypothetical protein
LTAFQVRRLEAMGHVADSFYGNPNTQKTPFVLPDLGHYEDKARTLAHALHEFLTIERLVELNDWKTTRQVASPGPPDRPGCRGGGLLGYGVSLTCFVLALRHLGTARTGAYFSLASFVGAASSLAIFQEGPIILFGVTAAIMGLVGWLHLTERHGHEHRHEPMEHDHSHVHDEHHRHEDSPSDPPGEPRSHPHYPDIHHRHDH